jgi:hypothetical protein
MYNGIIQDRLILFNQQIIDGSVIIDSNELIELREKNLNSSADSNE